jgi:hypothetical protein
VGVRPGVAKRTEARAAFADLRQDVLSVSTSCAAS